MIRCWSWSWEWGFLKNIERCREGVESFIAGRTCSSSIDLDLKIAGIVVGGKVMQVEGRVGKNKQRGHSPYENRKNCARNVNEGRVCIWASKIWCNCTLHMHVRICALMSVQLRIFQDNELFYISWLVGWLDFMAYQPW